MNTTIFPLSLLLMAMLAGTSVQAETSTSGSLPMRPMNLSARKPLSKVRKPKTPVRVLDRRTSLAEKTDQSATDDALEPQFLPYGSGFESRQQGATAQRNGNSGNSGSGGGGGGGGNGGGGSGGGGSGGR